MPEIDWQNRTTATAFLEISNSICRIAIMSKLFSWLELSVVHLLAIVCVIPQFLQWEFF